MSVTDEYLANNVKYAETFSGPLPLPPAAEVTVIQGTLVRAVHGHCGSGLLIATEAVPPLAENARLTGVIANRQATAVKLAV